MTTNNSWNSPYPSAKGSMIVGDGTAPPALLTVGSDGQVLTADAASTPGVKWSTPAASNAGLVWIATQTASTSATIDFTSGISSTYYNYRIMASNVASDTDNVLLQMKISTDGGSNYLGGTSYHSSTCNHGTVGGSSFTSSSGSASAAQWQIGREWDISSSAGRNGQFFMDIFHLTAGTIPGFSGQLIWMFDAASDAYSMGYMCGYYNSAVTVNALRFIFSSGNVSTGTFSLYGYVK